MEKQRDPFAGLAFIVRAAAAKFEFAVEVANEMGLAETSDGAFCECGVVHDFFHTPPLNHRGGVNRWVPP